MKLCDLRSAFITFFRERNHEHLPSSSLIGDSTLLFTNSGMVQFKDVFLGKSPIKYPRVVTSQKCVRAGGKHNDLENVGYTVRHHTFFEMLGNFSFGDYFKDDAIIFCWEFLTKVLSLPKDRLKVTINHLDDEARGMWKKISGLPDECIIPVEGPDNFWSMGDTGPCGPCSEVFFDYGGDYHGVLTADNYDPDERYIEIWNLVFMQNNAYADGTIAELPMKCIDTGMGIERIAAVCQGVRDNYRIDVFADIIKEIRAITGARDTLSPALRVIADHIRSSVFLIADGVLPGNVGREYALRKIIRRAVRYAGKLERGEFLLSKLVPVVTDIMGDQYPEIVLCRQNIISVLNAEEEQFSCTINSGMRFLNKCIAEHGQNIPEDLTFKLYDTYGFPFDLTKEILRENNITADEAVFNKCMNEQRVRGKTSWKGVAEECIDARGCVPTVFVGYDQYDIDCVVTGIFADGKAVDAISSEQKGLVALDKTPFYATSGGQVGDTGQLTREGVVVADVCDCVKNGHVYLHSVTALKSIRVGDRVRAVIDARRRADIAGNHTATHLLHYALRKVLGNQVAQKGSLVANDRLRFDFSFDRPPTTDEIARVEELVNDFIDKGCNTVTDVMRIDDAKKLGATALFGEKYDETVRVVTIGDSVDVSMELCGGSHVSNTSKIRLFKINSSSAIGAGLRRVEAVTGRFAADILRKREEQVMSAASLLKVKPDQLVAAVTKLTKDKEDDKTPDVLKYVQPGAVFMSNFARQSIYEAIVLMKREMSEIRGHVGRKDVSNDNDIQISEEELKIAYLAQAKFNENVKQLIGTCKAELFADSIYSDFFVRKLRCVVILMTTPRHTEYLHAAYKSESNLIVVGVEFLSAKFAKIRVLSLCDADDGALIRAVVMAKGNVSKVGAVTEAGFAVDDDRLMIMRDITKKLESYLLSAN